MTHLSRETKDTPLTLVSLRAPVVRRLSAVCTFTPGEEQYLVLETFELAA